jgi:hypothetical protein
MPKRSDFKATPEAGKPQITSKDKAYIGLAGSPVRPVEPVYIKDYFSFMFNRQTG